MVTQDACVQAWLTEMQQCVFVWQSIHVLALHASFVFPATTT
jgi:hypothetical protein